MSYILFVDSGLGGATIIKSLMEKYEKVNYIFHCENAFAPLGNLTKTQLENLALSIVAKYIKNYNIGIVVLACNTLTASSIDLLRTKFNKIPFVGVEPNIKIKQGKTLVLATKFTIDNNRLLRCCCFSKLALPELSILIDKFYPNLQKCKMYLTKNLELYKDYDNVILGCTHYELVVPYLQKIFKNATFYNSINGVVKRICNLYEVQKNCGGKQLIFFSKKDKKLQQSIKNFLQIT